MLAGSTAVEGIIAETSLGSLQRPSEVGVLPGVSERPGSYLC